MQSLSASVGYLLSKRGLPARYSQGRCGYCNLRQGEDAVNIFKAENSVHVEIREWLVKYFRRINKKLGGSL
jgi:hypothetical protein